MDVDINAKTVTVESETSEESIKQVIVAAGYAVEGYRADSSYSHFNISGDAKKIFYIFCLYKGGIEIISQN